MTSPEITFTEENISRLFGQEAAEDEDLKGYNLNYIKNKTHAKLTANLPLRMIYLENSPNTLRRWLTQQEN